MNNFIWDKKTAESRRDCHHPVVNDYAKNRVSYFMKKINSSMTDNCLELGAGDGFFSLVLKEYFNLCVIDNSAEMLKKNPLIENKFIMNSMNLAFPDNSFDIVFEANMLHHVEDYHQVLKEMVRVAKKYMVVIEPNRNNPLTIVIGLFIKNERNSLRFSKTFLKNEMGKFNLELVDCINFGIIPANRCPFWFWKIIKTFDGVIPFWGLETILIYRKK